MSRLTSEEKNASRRQMAVNIAWAVGSVISVVGTMLAIGWLRGSL